MHDVKRKELREALEKPDSRFAHSGADIGTVEGRCEDGCCRRVRIIRLVPSDLLQLLDDAAEISSLRAERDRLREAVEKIRAWTSQRPFRSESMPLYGAGVSAAAKHVDDLLDAALTPSEGAPLPKEGGE